MESDSFKVQGDSEQLGINTGGDLNGRVGWCLTPGAKNAKRLDGELNGPMVTLNGPMGTSQN